MRLTARSRVHNISSGRLSQPHYQGDMALIETDFFWFSPVRNLRIKWLRGHRFSHEVSSTSLYLNKLLSHHIEFRSPLELTIHKQFLLSTLHRLVTLNSNHLCITQTTGSIWAKNNLQHLIDIDLMTPFMQMFARNCAVCDHFESALVDQLWMWMVYKAERNPLVNIPVKRSIFVMYLLFFPSWTVCRYFCRR